MSEPFLPLSVRETLRLARLSSPSGSTNADMIDGAEDWMRVGARQLISVHAALDQLDKIGGTFQCTGPLDVHEIIPRSVWPDGELVDDMQGAT